MKKFNRPVPRYDEDAVNNGPMRNISLPREGSGIEGLYSEFASRDAMRYDSLEAQSKRAWSEGIRYWMLVIATWVVVVGVIMQLITR
jgi:hypothetical protein